jgi:hypothetical protein
MSNNGIIIYISQVYPLSTSFRLFYPGRRGCQFDCNLVLQESVV